MAEIKVDASKFVLVPINELKPNTKNRNNHPDDQIDDFVKIIKEIGFRIPLTVSNRTGLIVGGHGRLLAAKKIGMTHLPVIYQDFKSDEEEYIFGVSDNAISQRSYLDLSGINTDIPDLGPFDITLLGIKDFKIDVSDFNQELDDKNQKENEIDQEEREKLEEKHEQIPEKIEALTKPGSTFKIGPHILYNGDCIDILKRLKDDSIDSLVTDPPAGIAFMGKEWDEDKGGSKEWIAWMSSVMQECLRVLKPGAHGLVWAIPRTSHWTATALEDAGFEIRDVVTHLFGSGFPKSLDISKAIDKAAGAERDKGSLKFKGGTQLGVINDDSWEPKDVYETVPATPEAKQWQGWGTALKPASEHWILIRKPCSEKTVAANTLKHGTGGINIDASRIEGKPRTTHADGNFQSKTKNTQVFGEFGLGYKCPEPQGRFPSNLILSHNDDCILSIDLIGNETPKSPGLCTPGCAVAELDEQSGISKSSNHVRHNTIPGNGKTHGQMKGTDVPGSTSDSGGASRFFYCAKPSNREKNEGCEELPEKVLAMSGGAAAAAARGETEYHSKTVSGYDSIKLRSNFHPTVKSIKLMSYLITMVTPPEGKVLDCFGGSGTTLVAAALRKFEAVLIEKQTEYCDIILARAEFVTGKHSEPIKG